MCPFPFLRILKEIESVFLKKRANRVRVIKDKMYIFTIRETFVLSSICQKYQGSQIKAFLCLKLKGEWKREGDCDHKTAFIWIPRHFWHMLDKQVSRVVKTHISFFLTPPLFARFLRDTLSISLKMRKKGRGHLK